MSFLFNLILYQPLFNALVALYQTVAFGDLGVAIIILTVIIRAVLYPLFYKQMRQQTVMTRIQPDVERIQRDHKGNRQRQGEELMALYKTHRINPFSSFLLILIQLPIFIALFKLMREGIAALPPELFYPFIAPLAAFDTSFLGLINLHEPNILIVTLAALLQYLQGRAAMGARAQPASGEQTSPAARMTRQMVYIGPVLIFVFFYNLPAALGLYLVASTVFSIGQQFLINRSLRSSHGPVPANPQKSS